MANSLRFRIKDFWKIGGSTRHCRHRPTRRHCTGERSSFRHLLLLLRTFREILFSWRVAVAVTVRIGHFLVAIVAALVILVELFSHFRLRLRLEVFVDTLVVFVGASTIGDFTVTRSEVFVLERCGKDRTRLWEDPLAYLPMSPRAMATTYIISHFVLGLDTFCTEEVLQWLLFLAAAWVSYTHQGGWL